MRVTIGHKRISPADIAIIAHVFSMYFLYTSSTSVYTYITAIISMVLIVFENGLSLKLDVSTKWYFVFLLFCACSITYSINPAGSIKRTLLILLMCLNMYCIGIYASKENNLTTIKRAFMYMGPLLVIYVMLKNGIGITNNYRFGYGIINENTMAFELMISASITYKTALKNRWRPLYFVVLGLDVLGIFLCSSRSAYAALFMDFGLTYLMAHRFSVRNIFNVISLGITSLIGLSVLSWLSGQNSIVKVGMDRLFSTFDIIRGTSNDLSVASRYKMIEFGLNCFRESPIVGHGIDAFKNLYPYKEAYAHNNYIELLVDVGIIGLIIYYIAFVSVGFQTFKTWKVTGIISYFPLVVAVMVLGFGSVYYDLASVMYVLILACKDSISSMNGYERGLYDEK